ncbi:MAG: hypothetical protein Fur0012_02390 [Elusimicrobiota bacterium]
MKKTIYLLFAFLLLAFSVSAQNTRARRQGYYKYFTVKFKADAVKKNPNLPSGKASAFSGRAGNAVSRFRQDASGIEIYRAAVNLGKSGMDALLEEIRKDPEVESAEPVLMAWPSATPNDTYYSSQWHYYSSAAEKAALNLPSAWDITTGSPTIIVAVVDTGILSHEDIDSSRILPGYDMISDADIANDGDGRDSSPLDPGDWCTATEKQTPSSPCYDSYCESYPSDPYCQTSNSSWHGLHVSGTIGANTNNSKGVAGVDWKNKILPIRVLGKGGGSSTDIADAIRWAAGLPVSGAPSNPNPARVINMSLGGYGSCPSVIQDAINSAVSAGAAVVVAAGNENDLASSYFPANCQNVITVGAVNRNGDKASYGNYGSLLSLSAPGGETGNSVYSTLNNGLTVPVNDIYAGYSGTSMATPHVAGMISLMLAYKPLLSVNEIKYNVTKTARAFPSGSSCLSAYNCGAGLADALAALNNLMPSVTSITPVLGRNDGTVSITNLSGTGFLSGASVKLRRTGYADIPAQNVVVENLNKITCEFPIGGASTGTWNVEVLNLDASSASLAGAFTILYPPHTVVSITPSSGVNSGDLAITDLSGTGFLNGATVKLTKTGSTEFYATSVVVVSPTKITCTLPLAGRDTGAWNVVVTNPDGQSFTLSDAFNIRLPAPTLTSITPSSGTNTGVISITSIRGTNFYAPAAAILRRSGYSDIYAGNVNVVNSSTITCNFNINGAAAGIWNLIVYNPDGQSAALNNAFEIKNPPPSLSSIYPNMAVNYGNMNVQINGMYFNSGVQAALKKTGQSDLNCVPATLTGNYRINCSLNLSGVSAGSWDVWVSNTDGQSATLVGAFIVNNEAPYIESLSADTGINTSPFSLDIYGHGFLSSPEVKLSRAGYSDISASVNSVSSQKISCVLPIALAEPGDWTLSVKNTDGQISYYGSSFHIISPPAEKSRIYGGLINPAQGEKAHITSRTSSPGRYSVRIYDQAGRLVMTVFEGDRPAGSYDDIWSGVNEAGKKVSSGIYIVRIETPEYKETKRIVVVK